MAETNYSESNIQGPNPQGPNMTGPNPQEPNMAGPNPPKKSGKKILLIILIAVAAVLVVIFAIVIPMNKSAAYKNAVALMKEEQYAQAEEEFQKLGNYENAAEKAEECAQLKVKAAAYDTAMKDYEAGNWEAAKEIFDQIPDYKDSDELSGDCQNHLKYEQAEKLFAEEDYEGALAIYETIIAFEDSKKKADLCSEEIEKQNTYDQAVSDLKNGYYSEAKQAFDSLGDYKDSKEYSVKCNILTAFVDALELYYGGENKKAMEAVEEIEKLYDNAKSTIDEYGSMPLDMFLARCKAERDLNSARKKFEAGDYAGAKEKLDQIDESSLRDESRTAVSDMRKAISAEEKYAEAVDYYNRGLYYEAYVKLSECGDYKDAAELAANCAQPFPAAGVVYANEAYGDRSSQLTIDNTGFMNAYYKLYLGDDLVMTVFIPEDGSTTFYLPTGNYTMNKAYGNTWYGTEDMFGDDGYYWHCSFGGSDVAPIEAGYAYQISTGSDGTGISTSAADRNSF